MSVAKNKHKEMEKRVRDLDAVLTHAFRLPPHKLEFDNTLPHCGECSPDGKIRIRLTRTNSRTLLSWESLTHTIGHELAHLVYFRHGSAHKRLTIAFIEWMYQNDQKMFPMLNRKRLNKFLS